MRQFFREYNVLKLLLGAVVLGLVGGFGGGAVIMLIDQLRGCESELVNNIISTTSIIVVLIYGIPLITRYALKNKE